MIKTKRFRHLGAEYGSTLPDSAMTASSEKDHYFGAWRGRLNTPDDIADFVSYVKHDLVTNAVFYFNSRFNLIILKITTNFIPYYHKL